MKMGASFLSGIGTNSGNMVRTPWAAGILSIIRPIPSFSIRLIGYDLLGW